MDRRRYLAAFGALLTTGCIGENPLSGSETPTETPQRTSTRTPIPTDTPEPTPTRDEEYEASEYIDTAQDQFRDAVYKFTGDTSGELTTISADSEDFNPLEVLLELDSVQQSVMSAQKAAVTDEQETEVTRLQAIERFLTHATNAQANLIQSLDELQNTRDVLETDKLEDAEEAVEEFESRFEQAQEPIPAIVEETDTDSFSVTDVIDTDEYSAKAAQFEAETEGLETLSSAVDDILDAMDRIQDAEDSADDGNDDDAADSADRAAETLDDVTDELDDYLEDLPEEAESLENVSEDVADIAQSKLREAERIYDEYS